LNIEPNQFCVIDRLINLHLVGENTILLSDYNATAYDKTLLDRAMILSQEGGGAQMESFRGSAKKGFQADFEEKVQDNFTAYGFIGQSGEAQPNIPLIPNVVGGTCEDVNLTLNGNTFISVPSGDVQNIELLDQNGDPITPDDVTGNVITVDVGEPCPPASTNSAPLLKTGETVSFADFDDGFYQEGRDDSFFVLDFTNHFGSTWRFTGVTGGYYDRTTSQYKTVNGTVTTRATAYPNNVVCDWSTLQSATGGFLMYRFSYDTAPWDVAVSGVIPDINIVNFAGFNDWRLPNWREMWNVCLVKANSDYLQYEEAGNIVSFFILITGSLINASNCRYINNWGNADSISRTATGVWFLICRTANISEL
jgi:hypothetical protein